MVITMDTQIVVQNLAPVSVMDKLRLTPFFLCANYLGTLKRRR
ncbi:MAG: hypothetical protein R2784_10605 [Saprospiraceae bacterium]